MMTFPVPAAPVRNRLQKAYLILKHAHDTCESLLGTFESVRKARKAHGAPTDEEQDLLRAMVVFAGAGLDSMMKQVIRDALPGIMESDSEALDSLEKYSSKKLQRGAENIDEGIAGVTINARLLARILLSNNSKEALIELLIDDLTGGSLQSADELLRILPYLGVAAVAVGVSKKDLKPVFDCRNLLIHELDIDFDQPNRNRFPRRKTDMVAHTEKLLSVSANILVSVDKKLRPVRA